MKKFLAMLAAFAMLLATPAFAVGPSAVVITYPGQSPTFSATKLALAPAASATDFLTVNGAAGFNISIKRVICNGVSTANASALVQVVKRSTADTGGTSTTSTNVPYSSSVGAGHAVVKTYTVNPGALGTAIGTLAVKFLTTDTLASATINNADMIFDFTSQPVVLRSAAETLALNANAASFTAGASLNCNVEWSEGQ